MSLKRTEHVVDLAEIKAALKARGYQTKNVKAAVKAFQDIHGLPVTGWVGNRTWRAMNGLRLCGVPDHVIIDGRPQWPKVVRNGESGYWVGWYLQQSLPSLSDEVFRSAIQWAFGQWASVCGLRPYQAESAAAANVRITVANLGGPGGVLADSELPYSNRQVKQRYDSTERWVYEAQPQDNVIDVGRVVAHELGHAFGLGHTDEPGNLLNPTYSTRIRGPVGKWELSEMKKRYGEPVVATPTPPGGGKDVLVRLVTMTPGVTVKVVA